jgi:ADP-ribosylation factor 1/2
MGQYFTNLWNSMFTIEPTKILLIGLDCAGKTQFLYKTKLNEIATLPATIGFNIETIQVNNLTLTVWDIGGQEKIRQLWVNYYKGTDAVIFVVDSNDLNRIDEASKELHLLISSPYLHNKPVLIFGNKQDLPNALNEEELTEKLNLSNLNQNNIFLQLCCVMTGDGISEGMNWLSKNL